MRLIINIVQLCGLPNWDLDVKNVPNGKWYYTHRLSLVMLVLFHRSMLSYVIYLLDVQLSYLQRLWSTIMTNNAICTMYIYIYTFSVTSCPKSNDSSCKISYRCLYIIIVIWSLMPQHRKWFVFDTVCIPCIIWNGQNLYIATTSCFLFKLCSE